MKRDGEPKKQDSSSQPSPNNAQGQRAYSCNLTCEHLHRLNRQSIGKGGRCGEPYTLNAACPAPELRGSIQILCALGKLLSGTSVMSGARSANKLARDLKDALNEPLALDQLLLAKVTDGDTSEYSLINPTSISSSMGRTTLSSLQGLPVPCSGGVVNSPRPNMGGPGVGGAQGWRSQGEFSPLTPQHKGGGGSLFSVPKGGIGSRVNRPTSILLSPGPTSSSRAFMGSAKTTNFYVV